jgi:hypothetical protein
MGEEEMRLLAFALSVVAALVWGQVAEAGQQQPAGPPPPEPPMTLAEAGVTIDFPAPPMTYKMSYFQPDYTGDRQADIAGRQRMAAVHVLVRNNVVFRASVVNFSDKPTEAATLWGECIYLNEETGIEESNVSVPIGQGANTVYGRVQKTELRENQGHLHAGCYYHRNRLYRLEAIVLPARGDENAPEAVAFVRSIRFLN